MSRYVFQDKCFWDFPGGPVVKTPPSIQSCQVWSLVRELSSHMLLGQKRKEKKRNINRSNIVTDLIIVCVCVCVYIYIEREREREREAKQVLLKLGLCSPVPSIKEETEFGVK